LTKANQTKVQPAIAPDRKKRVSCRAPWPPPVKPEPEPDSHPESDEDEGMQKKGKKMQLLRTGPSRTVLAKTVKLSRRHML